MTFEKNLLDAIDEGLYFLGESAKQAIYFHLEKKYGISKQDFPNRIECFTEAIEDIFGCGAKVLEINIMKKLFHKMGYISLKLQAHEDLEFRKYIEAARTKSECSFGLVTCTQ